MNDIVERLWDILLYTEHDSIEHVTCRDAAAEIERLQQSLALHRKLMSESGLDWLLEDIDAGVHVARFPSA